MLSIHVAGKGGRSRLDHPSGSLDVGREPRMGPARLVINDPFVSGDQMRLEELPGGRIRVDNLSRRVPIGLAGGQSLAPGATAEVALPTRLHAGETLIDIELARAPDETGDAFSTLEPPAHPAGPSALGGDPATAEVWLPRWFEAVLAIQRAASTSGDFYREAARAVLDLVGLDSGIVLLRRGDAWEVAARADRAGREELGPAFSRTTLDRACAERRTFFQTAALSGASRSLEGVEAVVVSPILGSDGVTVVGAIYGMRLVSPSGRSAEIRPLEAQLVQILAAAIGAGTARVGAEAEASRRLVQFEQFFSPELARELEADPKLLDGRERTITALFSDIRGFSAFSERLAPREVCRLIGDVMDRLTARIREHGGVVVDYVGDGLLAMWNAPTDQPDHARLACQAARAMIDELPGLNRIWEPGVGVPLKLGIGLNTGEALVGNTGSRARFKYGPLGHVVNLASRVEGATKQFGVPILLTGSTQAALGGSLPTRRLCRLRVVGIAGAVDLHELPSGPIDEAWDARRGGYEAGLARFEAGDFPDACRLLYPVLGGGDAGYDLPTLTLIGRAVEQLKAPGRPFDPVIELSTK